MPIVSKHARPLRGPDCTYSIAGKRGSQRNVSAGRSDTSSVTVAATSIAVPHTSPSPWAKWTSPTDSKAPGT